MLVNSKIIKPRKGLEFNNLLKILWLTTKCPNQLTWAQSKLWLLTLVTKSLLKDQIWVQPCKLWKL